MSTSQKQNTKCPECGKSGKYISAVRLRDGDCAGILFGVCVCGMTWLDAPDDVIEKLQEKYKEITRPLGDEDKDSFMGVTQKDLMEDKKNLDAELGARVREMCASFVDDNDGIKHSSYVKYMLQRGMSKDRLIVNLEKELIELKNKK